MNSSLTHLQPPELLTVEMEKRWDIPPGMVAIEELEAHLTIHQHRTLLLLQMQQMNIGVRVKGKARVINLDQPRKGEVKHV